jgi:hypothetical protein
MSGFETAFILFYFVSLAGFIYTVLTAPLLED